MTAVFECAKCGDVFEGDGLHVIVHETSAGRVCPACLTNAGRVTVIVERERPGKPYEIVYTEIKVSDDVEENGLLPGKR